MVVILKRDLIFFIQFTNLLIITLNCVPVSARPSKKRHHSNCKCERYEKSKKSSSNRKPNQSSLNGLKKEEESALNIHTNDDEVAERILDAIQRGAQTDPGGQNVPLQPHQAAIGFPQAGYVPVPNQANVPQGCIPVPNQVNMPQGCIPVPNQVNFQGPCIPVPNQVNAPQGCIPAPNQANVPQCCIPVPNQSNMPPGCIPVPNQSNIPPGCIPVPNQSNVPPGCIPVPNQSNVPQNCIPVPNQVNFQGPCIPVPNQASFPPGCVIVPQSNDFVQPQYPGSPDQYRPPPYPPIPPEPLPPQPHPNFASLYPTPARPIDPGRAPTTPLAYKVYPPGVKPPPNEANRMWK